MLFTEQPGNGFGRVFQKFQEWIISVRLERQYTKEEIITLYLNKFDWIHQAVGIKSAASIYFDSSPDSLRLEQAAMLVGMAKNPALFNPVKRPDETLERRNVVLKQMVRNNYLSKEAYDSLKTLPLGLDFQKIDRSALLAIGRFGCTNISKTFREKRMNSDTFSTPFHRNFATASLPGKTIRHV